MDKKLSEIISKLKTQGIRITPQRRAILEYLLTKKNHPSADQIHESLAVKFPGLSITTVYNNLRQLQKKGLIKELKYSESSRFDANIDDHYHISCQKCNTITDFHYPSLKHIETSAAKDSNYIIQNHRLELYGVCPKCQQEERK